MYEENQSQQSRSPFLLRMAPFLMVLFMRVLACAFFILTVQVWLHAIGYWEGGNSRFDTMDVSYKIYTAVLAVLLPVASVGLWTTLSWGRVVWFIAVAIHLFAYSFYAIGFAFIGELIAFHFFCLILYGVFRIYPFLITNKE